ncbi:LEA type 2 family protein [bacterium]
MKRLHHLLWIALLVLFVGCAALQELIQKPSLKYEKMTAKDVSLFQSTLLFHFTLTNPNPIGAKIRNIVYNIKFNDKEFAKGNLDKGVYLAARGSSDLELPVTVTYLDLFGTVADFLTSDQVRYDLSGSVGIGPFDLPYHTEGEIPIPKLPKISLQDVRISKLSLTGATMKVSLGLENNNAFAVNIDQIQYRIKLAGIPFAEGIAETISNLNENGHSALEIPLTISFVKMGQSTYNLLTKSASDYELSGDMIFQIPGIGEKKFEFKKTGKIKLRK